MSSPFAETATITDHVADSFRDFYVSHTPTSTNNQFAFARTDDSPTAFAFWMESPQSVPDLANLASDVVRGVVTDIAEGPVIGEYEKDPDGTIHDSTLPTRRITVEVLERFKGDGADTMTIFQMGGMLSTGMPLVLDGDPEYALGENILLYLRPKVDEDGTHLVVAPERAIPDSRRPSCVSHGFDHLGAAGTWPAAG